MVGSMGHGQVAQPDANWKTAVMNYTEMESKVRLSNEPESQCRTANPYIGQRGYQQRTLGCIIDPDARNCQWNV